MQVKDILGHKGHEIFSISPTATVREMAIELSVQMVGVLVCVDESGSLIGMVSERDLTHAVAHHGAQALNLLVSEILNRDVFACNLEDDIGQMLTVMTESRCRHLPVIDEGRLVGLISVGDLVKAVSMMSL